MAGNNQVPTILLIKIALNKINKLINIDNNFDKISRANFVCVFVRSQVDTYMGLNLPVFLCGNNSKNFI